MKTDRQLVNESIDHWERIVERLKWVMESGLIGIDEPINKFTWVILDESPYADDCSLCRIYFPQDENGPCDCTSFYDTPWQKTTRNINHYNFIVNAEKHMIPALYECLKYCKDE